jgi:hypothetical protein
MAKTPQRTLPALGALTVGTKGGWLYVGDLAAIMFFIPRGASVFTGTIIIDASSQDAQPDGTDAAASSTIVSFTGVDQAQSLGNTIPFGVKWVRLNVTSAISAIPTVYCGGSYIN